MTPPIIIINFPLPPSENAIYANRSEKGKRGRHKTEACSDYEDRVFMWSLKNRPMVANCSKYFKEWVAKPRGVVRIDFYFVFEKSRIIKRDGSLKRKIDPLNYTKALCDCLSQLVKVDDSYFEAGIVTKSWTSKKNKECTILAFSPSTINESDI